MSIFCVVDQELNESVSRSRTVVEEVDGRIHDDYQNKLCEALKKMREEMDEQLRQNNEETEAFYERKVPYVLCCLLFLILYCSSGFTVCQLGYASAYPLDGFRCIKFSHWVVTLLFR